MVVLNEMAPTGLTLAVTRLMETSIEPAKISKKDGHNGSGEAHGAYENVMLVDESIKERPVLVR